MTDPPYHFNLWIEPWIRVNRHDGEEIELGIGACLTEAHTLAALSDPSPLVVGGTHRLLAAILQACYAPQEVREIATVLGNGHFDQSRLDTFAAENGGRLDLFHPTAPFLQTGDIPLDSWQKPGKEASKEVKDNWAKPNSAAVLFAEVPGATNRTHFHHVTDEDHYLCPACCARGLVSVPAFASSGGAGIRPSINGVPPIYVLPAGDSLFESLTLSLVSKDFQPSAADPQRAHLAIWNGPAEVCKGGQVSAVGYLESLTFPARRMRLYPQTGAGRCTHCGQPTPVGVALLLFEMGHWLSEGSGIWDDPFAAFRKPRGKGKGDDVGPRPVRPEEGKALWREYSGLLLAEREEQLRPKVVRQLARLIDDFGVLTETQRIRFRCVGIRTDGKAKIFEWLDEALEVPPALLSDDLAAYLVNIALERAGDLERVIGFTFDQHFRPRRSLSDRVDQRVVRFKTLRARMIADYWGSLAPHFRRWVSELADEAARETAEAAWAQTSIRAAQSAFDHATEQVGERADALRARVMAQDACRYQLAKKRKEWFSE